MVSVRFFAPYPRRKQGSKDQHDVAAGVEAELVFDGLEREKATGWDGVRNYQARNFMRDEMEEGDLILFYHSNAKPPGVAGMGCVSQTGLPDLTALNPESEYYDPKATKEDPRWMMVEVAFVEKFPTYVSLSDLKNVDTLKDMPLLQKGNRLSILPLKKREFRKIVQMAGAKKKI